MQDKTRTTADRINAHSVKFNRKHPTLTKAAWWFMRVNFTLLVLVLFAVVSSEAGGMTLFLVVALVATQVAWTKPFPDYEAMAAELEQR